MKILIIGVTHGNELLGVKLYQRLLRQRSPLLEHIDFMVGNPRAYHARQRYIDCDLNRSYGQSGTQYEQKRAQKILRYIARTKPDLVVDMHATSCHQPNCLIVNRLDNPMVQRLLRASHIPVILRIQSMDDIASIVPNAVGYEIPNRHISPALLDDIAQDLQRCVDSVAKYPKKQMFTMTDKIYKNEVSDEQARTFVNFEPHSLGFVPIMTGNNSYKKQTDYLGFKSTVPQKITL